CRAVTGSESSERSWRTARDDAGHQRDVGMPVRSVFDPSHAGPAREGGSMGIGVPASDLGRNLILAPLPEAERVRIAERAEPYESDHQVLVQPGGTIEHAYFPSLGLISVVAALRNGRRAEIATVGWEG